MANIFISRKLRKASKNEKTPSLPSLVMSNSSNHAAKEEFRKSHLDELKLPAISWSQRSFSDPVRRRHVIIQYDIEPLTIPSLVLELCEISNKWKTLALKLGFSEEIIQKIEKDNVTYSDRCLITVLTYWFRKTPNSTWQEIIDILNSSEIAEPGIATRIMREYC